MKQLQVIGHLGKDAETIDYQGQKFISFSVAISEKYKRGGEIIEKTTWVKVNSNNTNIVEYLQKGAKVFVQGNFNLSTFYSEKLNTTLPEIRINANIIQLLSSKSKDEPQEDDSENLNETPLPF